MSESNPIELSPVEARVLAVLVEKMHTVPDTYPLSINALLAGCNQKTSRDPVMEVSDAEVHAALESLRRRSLVIESSGGRVMRYSENARRGLGLPGETVALMATLMLRGPQTAAELRANCERLHRFSDVSAVEAYLDELAARQPQAFVVKLARQPGARESRWMHLLCGEPSAAMLTGGSLTDHSGPLNRTGAALPQGTAAGLPLGSDRPSPDWQREFETLRARVDQLESQIARLDGLLSGS
jgi:uncharacterized protein YceH (UPF0502 family)